MRPFAVLIAICVSAIAQNTPADKQQLAVVTGKTLGMNGQPLAKATLTLRPLAVPRNQPGAAGPGAVAGGVIGSIGTGVAGAGPQPAPPYTATSDAQGNFTFDGVEPGGYLLQADHAGYLVARYGAVGNPGGGGLLTLKAGQRMSDVNLRLQPQSIVSGRVLDEDGEPPARVQVGVMRRMYGPTGQLRYQTYGSAVVDDRGDYRITGLAAGRYYVSAMPMQSVLGAVRRAAGNGQPLEGPVTTYFPSVIDMNEAALLDVAPGQDLGGINIKLRKAPVYIVRGRLGGALPPARAGQPSRLMIMVQDSIAGRSTRAVVPNPDGSFEIGGLPGGSHQLALQSVDGRPIILATRLVTITNGDLDSVSLDAVAPAEIRGMVRIEPAKAGSNPPAQQGAGQLAVAQGATLNGGATTERGITLLLMPAALGMPIGPVPVGTDGAFTMPNVSPGKYTLNVLNRTPGGYVKSATLGGRDILGGVDLTGGAAGSLDIVVSPNGGTITGVAKDAAGQPAGNRTLTLIPEAIAGVRRPDLYKTSRSRPTGEFQLTGVAPGKYRLYAWEDLEQGMQFDPDFMKLHESKGQALTVEENSSQQVTLVQ